MTMTKYMYIGEDQDNNNDPNYNDGLQKVHPLLRNTVTEKLKWKIMIATTQLHRAGTMM